MINLINTYVEMQKKLDEEHGILGVSTSYSRPSVHVGNRKGLDHFMKISEGHEVFVEKRAHSEYPFEAIFEKSNIKFTMLLTREQYEEIIKIEGVKHE